RMPHIWMIIFGVLTFFAKTVVAGPFKAFVRWSLPRFRYDQLMKLGWTVLLPASLANIFATGIIWLALQSAGPNAQAGAKMAADICQGITAAVITALVAWAVIGFSKNPLRKEAIVGSSATLAAAAGGSKEAPITA